MPPLGHKSKRRVCTHTKKVDSVPKNGPNMMCDGSLEAYGQVVWLFDKNYFAFDTVRGKNIQKCPPPYRVKLLINDSKSKSCPNLMYDDLLENQGEAKSRSYNLDKKYF